MKSGKFSIALGVVAAVAGLIMLVFNCIETYNIVNGIWTPVNENGDAIGVGLYVALLCVGAVLLIGGIACIVMGVKKNKK